MLARHRANTRQGNFAHTVSLLWWDKDQLTMQFILADTLQARFRRGLVEVANQMPADGSVPVDRQGTPALDT